jgi:hypothetical protein
VATDDIAAEDETIGDTAWETLENSVSAEDDCIRTEELLLAEEPAARKENDIMTEELAVKNEAVGDENGMLFEPTSGEGDIMDETPPDKDVTDEDAIVEESKGDIGVIIIEGISDSDESAVLSATTIASPATSSCGNGTPGGQLSWKTTSALGFAVKSLVLNGSGVPSARVLRSSLYTSSESERTLK